MAVTIYHNPACGTSRNTLAMIRQSGVEPARHRVSEVRRPRGRSSSSSVSAIGRGARGLLRNKGTLFEELGLDTPSGATMS